jgi:hypothetical protein
LQVGNDVAKGLPSIACDNLEVIQQIVTLCNI